MSDVTRPLKLKKDWKEHIHSDHVLCEYGNVVCSFANSMYAELTENVEKGDRNGWKSCEVEFMLQEVEYHLEKLRTAVEKDDSEKIKEHAADVANNALMVADIKNII